MILVDRYGVAVGVHGHDRGEPVDVSTLPPHVIDAFLATEDRTFFHHVGINPLAIARALIVNVRQGEVAQGGSTITQQLVKNLLLTPEQTYRRKVEEMLLALRIEGQYTKKEILELYLNAVYFGNNAYGLEAAARRYFGKPPQALTVGESAMLAGLLKAPSRFSPARDQKTARGRASVVLHLMADAGFITRAEADRIIAQGIATIIPDDHRAGYAVNYAVEEVNSLIGPIKQDVTVYTSLDTAALYRTIAAREAISASDPLYTSEVQTAAVAMEYDGAIRVMIGGNEFADNQFNRVTMAHRQPGSVFKPFVYLAAIENGWYPEDLVDDSPIDINGYEPKNYKNVYAGQVPLSEALRRSLNAAAIRLQEEVGRNKVVAVARRAGLTQTENIGPSLALGVMEATPMEIAQSFLPFVNDGSAADPYIVVRIETKDGDTLYEREPYFAGKPLFKHKDLVAFDYMMRDVVQAGSGRRARLRGHFAAGKTGTSQDSRDAWFAGYVSGMVGVVWLGKDDDTPMANGHAYISGSGSPTALWAEMMRVALGDRPAIAPERYIPRPPPKPSKSLYEHLKNIFAEQEMEQQRDAAPSTDEVSQVLAEVGEGAL